MDECPRCGYRPEILTPPSPNGRPTEAVWNDMFDRWWDEGPTPRRIAKAHARRAWRRLCPPKAPLIPEAYKRILELTRRRWQGAWDSRDPELRPYPATFLNREEP